MLEDRIKWNKKHQQGNEPSDASSIVAQFFGLASGNKALDIAAGNGRNSIFLAEHGFVVDAIDISEAGLARFAGRRSNINPICADLDIFDIPPDRYDLIVNIKFLSRRLFPYIYEGLTDGGILIFETFIEAPDEKIKQPNSRDYLLRENELLHAFLRLKIIYYREGRGPDKSADTCLASLVAIKRR